MATHSRSKVLILPTSNRGAGRSPRPGTTARLNVVLEMQTSSAEWLREYLREDERGFVLASANGRLTFRARLYLRERSGAPAPYVNGKVLIDWSRSTVSHGDQRTTLSHTELRLLAVLVESEADAIDRATLIARVWPNHRLRFGERENALAVYVHSLRKRLGAIGIARLLRTVRGVGYKVDFKYLNPPKRSRYGR